MKEYFWKGVFFGFLLGMAVGGLVGVSTGYGLAFKLDITEHFMKVNDHFLDMERNGCYQIRKNKE